MTPSKTNPMALSLPSEIIAVGAGGTASYMLPVLAKLIIGHPSDLIIVDADILEERNIDRQLFSRDYIGQPKAAVLAGMLGNDTKAMTEWFAVGLCTWQPGALFISLADNHAARRAVLEEADRTEGHAIITGNEEYESEAYYYHHPWKDGPLDPRVYYDLSGNEDNPTAPQGCTGVITMAKPQLASANQMAAAFGMQLVLYWFSGQGRNEYSPVLHHNSISRMFTKRMCDFQPKETE